jgi:uncharacterized paraquat-inducible protein A
MYLVCCAGRSRRQRGVTIGVQMATLRECEAVQVHVLAASSGTNAAVCEACIRGGNPTRSKWEDDAAIEILHLFLLLLLQCAMSLPSVCIAIDGQTLAISVWKGAKPELNTEKP